MKKTISLTKSLLFALEKTVDGYVRLEDFAYNTNLYTYGYGRPLKKSNLSQSLRRLRLNGYINLERFNQDLVVKLTDKGRAKLLINKTLETNKWDGKWRIVVFDVPESHRKIRNTLRGRLKLWGFTPWQKSVWATKNNVTKPFRDFINEVGAKQWVLIFESENTGV